MKTSQLKRKTALKRSRGIAPVSAKRKRDSVLYRDARAAYMTANPLCHWPGCQEAATEIHHAAGRVGERGARYLDPTWFRGLCSHHHRHAHAEPLEAKTVGVSAS